jgi:tetratricopeptide (TPR) repeat protein
MTKVSWVCVALCASWILAGRPVAGQSPQPEQVASAPESSRTNPAQPDPGDFDPVRRLWQQGKYDDAIAALHGIEEKHPATRGLSHELGIAYYRKGDYLSAVASLKKAQEENASDGEAVQLLGLSYYLAGRPAEAIPLLEKVPAWFPSANVDAAYILGICYIQTKDYSHARGAFAKMFGVPPESAASYFFTARMLLRQDLGPVAEDYAQKAATLDAKLPLVHFLLGELNLYHAKIPEAIAEFQKELDLNPVYAAAYYKLAEAYSRTQKYDEAEKVLQRSIWLDATSSGSYILMGKVLEKKGENELAVRAWQRALAMDSNNPVPHHLLGQTYRDMGRSEDAERELKIAGQLEERQNAKP